MLFQIPDATGRMPKMVLWRAPGTDVTGMVCRCEKVVTTSEKVGTNRERGHMGSVSGFREFDTVQ